MVRPRVYDFTTGLHAAKQAIEAAPSEPIRPPRQSDESERLITEAFNIVVADLKTRNELTDVHALIQRAMETLDDDLMRIKSQIEAAKGQANSGRYSDPHWWSRVNYANRFKGAQRQRLQNKFGEINRRLRAENLKRTEVEFIKIARQHLPKETFQMLWHLYMGAMYGDKK